MKKIKELGLEKEYRQWIKDVRSRNRKIRIGDIVELVKEPINVYSDTIPIGAQGEVIGFSKSFSGEKTIKIDFYGCGEKNVFDRNRFRII